MVHGDPCRGFQLVSDGQWLVLCEQPIASTSAHVSLYVYTPEPVENVVEIAGSEGLSPSMMIRRAGAVAHVR
jgi:hypothetical protein